MTAAQLCLLPLLPAWAAAVWWMAATHSRARRRASDAYVDFLLAAGRTPPER